MKINDKNEKNFIQCDSDNLCEDVRHFGCFSLRQLDHDYDPDVIKGMSNRDFNQFNKEINEATGKLREVISKWGRKVSDKITRDELYKLISSILSPKDMAYWGFAMERMSNEQLQQMYNLVMYLKA